jgi:fatty acid desaturase
LVVVVAGHASIPWPVSIAVLSLLGGLQMSLQHEAIHGHPTPWRRLNTILVGAPTYLWCPYREYRISHLQHHGSELTVPVDDPESFHVTADAWQRANPVLRALWTVNRTLLGRLVIGPWLSIVRTLRRAALATVSDPVARRTWAGHVVLAGACVWLAVGVAGLPWWEYVVGLTWGGTAWTNLRSFAEHRYTGSADTPCAVVRSNRAMSLLFLNNNLHHTHHALPGAAWYRLPQLHDQLGSSDLARAGAGWYRGYLEVARLHLVRPFGAPVHPAEQP